MLLSDLHGLVGGIQPSDWSMGQGRAKSPLSLFRVRKPWPRIQSEGGLALGPDGGRLAMGCRGAWRLPHWWCGGQTPASDLTGDTVEWRSEAQCRSPAPQPEGCNGRAPASPLPRLRYYTAHLAVNESCHLLDIMENSQGLVSTPVPSRLRV